MTVHLSVQHILALVLIEILRIISVRRPLREISVEIVISLIHRTALSTGTAKAPFANAGGSITLRLKYLSNSHLRTWKMNIKSTQRGLLALVSPHKCVTGMLSCHKAATRRGAYGRTGIMMGEQHRLPCQGINVRSLDQFLSIAADIADSHIIRKHKYDIRFLRCLRRSNPASGRQQRRDHQQFVIFHSNSFPDYLMQN